MAFENNKIKFLQGTAAKLAGLSSSEAGAFYLTNDTHELYVGLGENQKPVALNRWVDIVKNIEQIANIEAYKKVGKLYYITDDNILCTWDNTQNKWIQINPDTNTSLNTVTISDGEKREGAIAYTLTFKQTDKSGKVIEPDVTAELVITEDMVTSLVVDVEVDVTATVSDNVATIKTNGKGATFGDGYKVKGKDGIVITTEEGFDGYVIDGTTYELEADGTKIQLRNSNGTGSDDVDIDGIIEFTDDDKWIEVNNDGGKIKVAHIGKSSAEITPTSGTAKELVDDEKIEVITGLTIEEGHITGYEVSEYTAQDTTYTVETEIDTDKTVKVSLRNADTNQIDSFDNVDISSDLIVNGVTKKIQPTGSITLDPYYTKEEVDAQHRAINAMVYKGVVDSTHALPSTAEIGWTYKVGEEGTYAGIECSVGDILIANGEEADGVLTSITWDHIDTSDFEDTTYDLQAKDNQIILHNNVTLNNDKIVLDDDNIVILTAKQVTEENGTVVDKLIGEHAAITIAKPAASEEELEHAEAFTVITELKDDGHGHITEINTTKFTLPASGDTVEADAANVKLTFKDVDGQTQGSIDLDDDDVVVVEGASSDNKNLVATIKHAKVTKADTEGTAAPEHGSSTLKVVEAVTYNDYGHVTGVKTTTVTLPEETEYEIAGPTGISKGVKYELKNDADETKGTPIELVSDSLTVAVSGAQTAIDIVWGSF